MSNTIPTDRIAAAAKALKIRLSGTSVIHCQCGPATCVVGEFVTGQAKNYSLQCVK